MSDQRVQRRLAAVLAADVAGYSRLMEADEEGTLAALALPVIFCPRDWFVADSALERAGFEPSVPRRGRRRLRKFSRCRLFRLSGAEVSRRNAGRIGGFEEGEFEADGATKRSGMTVVPT